MAQSKIKIAMIGEMLSKGGAERVQARLSGYFAKEGIEVHHIIFIDEVTYSYAGKILNLGKQKTKNNKFLNKWLMLKALRAYLKEHTFDFLIDFRAKHNYFQELVINRFIYNAPYVVSVRSSNLHYHFPKNRFFARIIYSKCFGFVGVSQSITSKVTQQYGFKNVTTIYNPIDIEEIDKLSNDEIQVPNKYILGIGRMKDNVKQFDHLIKAFQISEATSQNIKLVIVGEGEYKTELEKLVLEKNLKEDVVFYPFAKNPFPYYKYALFTAMTSKFEGFPNVLIESLATGTPVVSYNCNSGPNEIINHKENGLIVKNQDVDEMALAINSMLLDKTLYEKCRQNAKQSVARFSPNHILIDWLKFLELN